MNRLLCVLFASSALFCASWSKPETLTSYSHKSMKPRIAVNSTGYSIAVWSEFDRNQLKIRSCTRTHGSNWTPSVDLSDGYENAFDPFVAINKAGDAIAVWSSYDGQNASIRVKFKYFGEGWSKEFVLTDSYFNAFSPQAAIDDIGNITIVWEKFDGMGLSVQAIHRTYYGLWSEIVDISNATEYGFQPKLAANACGKAIIIWTGYDGQNLYTEASAYEGNYYWSFPVYLSSTGLDSVNPQIAINNEGDAIAVWSSLSGIQAAVMSPLYGWSPPAIISNFGENAYNPQIAIDDEGNGVAVWRSNSGSNYMIESSRLYIDYSATGNGWFWTNPIFVSNFGENGTAPTVAMDPYGNATALWTSLRGSHFVLQAASLGFGNSWTYPVDISDPSCDAITPVIKFDGEGNAIAIWAELYSQYVIQTSCWNNSFSTYYY